MVEQEGDTQSRQYSREQAVALALFDAVAGKLPNKARRLLLLAVAAHAGAAQRPDQSDRAGRDRVLAARLPHLNAQHQAIIASAVALQRAKVRPQRESAFVWLDKKERSTALYLAAVMRVAGAADVEPGDLLVQCDGDKTTVTIGGPRAEQALAAVEERAALWRDQIGELVAAAEPGALVVVRPTGAEAELDEGNRHRQLRGCARPNRPAGRP